MAKYIAFSNVANEIVALTTIALPSAMTTGAGASTLDTTVFPFAVLANTRACTQCTTCSPLSMLTEGATLTRTTIGFHTAMDTEATTAALCTACLAFTMRALLVNPHVENAVQ